MNDQFNIIYINLVIYDYCVSGNFLCEDGKADTNN